MSKEVDKLQFDIYSDYIEKLAKNKLNFEFPNSSEKHAIVVLKNILKYSNTIHIYDLKMIDEKIYIQLLEPIKEFIKSGGNIKVTTHNETISEFVECMEILGTEINKVGEVNEQVFFKGDSSIRRLSGNSKLRVYVANFKI